MAKEAYKMMHVSEPKYYKCHHCKRQFTKNEYLGYWCCDWCEDNIKQKLEAHFNKYVESKIYDGVSYNRPMVVIRDKVELWIVINYVRSIINQTNSNFLDGEDEEHQYSQEEINVMIKECKVGMCSHSLLMHYQNEEWREIILNHRISKLGIKYERGQ